ncbi:flavodoxin [Salinispira pacifica]
MTVAIIFGSSTGNTEYVANKVLRAFGEENARLHNISDPETLDVMRSSANLVCCLSTWGAGDMQDDWDALIEELRRINYSGKKVAILGLADQQNYPDTFADGMAVLAKIVRSHGGAVIGQTSSDGYSFTASRAEQDGRFLGLVIDEDNQSDQTDTRIREWVNGLKKQFR